MTDVVDAEAVEVGQEVAVVETPSPALFGTADPAEVIQRATNVADALADVIARKNLFTKIQGKDHVNVDGWQLCGAMLGVTAVCVETVEVDGGYRATVEARTPDGRVVGRADALCTKHEKRGPWKTSDDYARLSMAQTRATSKALKGPLGFVVSLAGYSATPSEEMTFAESSPTDTGTQGSGADPSSPAPEPTISAETYLELEDAAKSSGKKVGELALILTSIGVSVPKPTRKADVESAMQRLTVEQADKFREALV